MEKMRKRKILPKRKSVFVRFLLSKICEGESLNTRIYFCNILAKKKANRNFVFEKSKKRIQRRDFHSTEHKQRVFFFNKKNMLCSHFFKGVFYFVKSRHWKMAQRESLQKRCYKKRKGEKKVVEMRRH